jgi:general secretion pathway protein B
MSFILKALQKVEEEKAARRAGPQEISRAILAAGAPSPRTSRVLPAVAAVVLLVFAGGGLAYLLVQRGAEPARKPEPAPLTRESLAAVPRLPPADASPPVPVAEGSAALIPAATTAASPAKPPHVGRVEQGAASPAVEKKPSVSPTATARKSAMAPLTGPDGTEKDVSYGPPPAGLKVNGIALRDDPAESIAVVNGLLVRRGMVVQGMKVEEILSDRVRFSGNGGRCEVKISK